MTMLHPPEVKNGPPKQAMVTSQTKTQPRITTGVRIESRGHGCVRVNCTLGPSGPQIGSFIHGTHPPPPFPMQSSSRIRERVGIRTTERSSWNAAIIPSRRLSNGRFGNHPTGDDLQGLRENRAECTKPQSPVESIPSGSQLPVQ